jgi:hypothetical protein
MIELRNKLDRLAKCTSELNDYGKRKEHEKIKKEALKVLSELEKLLKNKNLGVREWNEIYETIQPYTVLDLSVKNTGIIGRVQSLFTTVRSPKKQVQDLVDFVDQKLIQSVTQLFNLEKTNAKKEHQLFIQTMMTSKEKIFDASEIREYILSTRAKNPRLTLSVSDEVALLQEILSEKIEGLKMGPPDTIESLKEKLKLFQENLFAFQKVMEKSSGEKDPLGTVTVQPKDGDLNKEAIERLRMQRLYRLENLQKVYQQSVVDSSREVVSKYFAPTYAWYVGALPQEESGSLLEIEMQHIGKKHDIKVVSDLRFRYGLKPVKITEDYQTDFMLNCQPIYGSNIDITNICDFNQDYVDFSKNGEVRIPRLSITGEDKKIYEQVSTFRQTRSEEWKKIINDNPGVSVPILGTPFCGDLSLKAIAFASAFNAIPVMNLTYNEGGNTLMGKKGSQPYVIIGQDSYDLSKLLMEKDLGRAMTYDEVRMAFAVDYGILKENVHFVEQPGDFHLDMSMAIVGENTILVNDAALAQNEFADHQQRWLQTSIDNAKKEGREDYQIASISEQTKGHADEEIRQSSVRKKMEDITAENLKALGFNVIRVPGRFHYTSRNPAMNLFNFVSAETAKGQKILVLMGCVDKQYQDRFTKILNENSDQKIDEFHFLNLESSQTCLMRGGGISCRTKTIPR